jgi:hypothetical protein
VSLASSHGLWARAAVTAPATVPLQESLRCDMVIVGGCYTGTSLALSRLVTGPWFRPPVEPIGDGRTPPGRGRVAEDHVEEGRPDLSAAVDGDRHGRAIGVVPPFVAAGLSKSDEAKLTRHSPKLPRGGTRHSRFRSCPPATQYHAPDTPRRSCRRHYPTLPKRLFAWPSGHSNPRWQAPRRPRRRRPGDRARSCRRPGLGGSHRKNSTPGLGSSRVAAASSRGRPLL